MSGAMELYTSILTTSGAFAKWELMRLPVAVRERVVSHVIGEVVRAIKLPVNHWVSALAKQGGRVYTDQFRRMREWWDMSPALLSELSMLLHVMQATPAALGVDSGVFGMLMRPDIKLVLQRLGCADLSEYCSYYARHIREWARLPLRQFFYIELDVVAVSGYRYSQQLEFRRRLREETGIPPVPVYQALIGGTAMWAEILGNESSRVAVALSPWRFGFNKAELIVRPQTYAYLRVLYRMARAAGKEVHLLGLAPTLRRVQDNGILCDSCDLAVYTYLLCGNRVSVQTAGTRRDTGPRTARHHVKVLRSDVFLGTLKEVVYRTCAYRDWRRSYGEDG